MTAKAIAPVTDSPSVASADWFLRPQTQAVFACLNRDGFEARAVGGVVRNSLLGRAVTEVDFATDAKPEDIVRLADEAGLAKLVPTGIAHGTVTVIAGGVPFEVTSLRRDVETDGRHATVAFGGDWAGDARRRDFTMNALYADAAGKVHDPLGGLSDLRAGRVRFVGDAAERIREDYLRTLRFFRFSADYSHGDFDAAGVAAAIRERAGLSRLSRERVRMEMLRILLTRRAPEAIEVMDESGLLLLLLGGVVRRARFERLCQIEAALERAPDAILRLAALGLFVEEDAGRLTRSSGFPRRRRRIWRACPRFRPLFRRGSVKRLWRSCSISSAPGFILGAFCSPGRPPVPRQMTRLGDTLPLSRLHGSGPISRSAARI